MLIHPEPRESKRYPLSSRACKGDRGPVGSNERGNQTRQQSGQESGASLDASVAGSPSANAASTHARGPRLLFLLLLALVVLAPLPQGGREPWSAFLLIAWVGGMLTLACAATLVGSLGRSLGGTHDLWPPTSSMRVPILLFLGTCAWTAVQWMPWTPAALHHPLWADAEATLGQSLPGSISLNPGQTIASGLQLLAYGGVFVLALGLGRDAGRARRGLQVFVYASFAYALYGLIAFFSGSELILWFGERRGTVSLTSTFENRNSYATLAGMGLVAAFALFLDGLGSVLRARVPPRTRLRWTLHHIFGPAAPLLVATLVIATALLLTASRGGTLSALFGLLVLAGAFSRAGALPARPVSIIVGAILLAGVLVFTLSGDHLAKRLELIDPEMNGRAAVYKTVLGAVADAPLLGTGYGTFADVFPLYRDASIPRTERWEAAHNTYLENALELGVPAALALFGSIAACARICWLGIRRRRQHRVYPMIGVAVTALVATHAWVDFSLQIPAISYAYAFLLGLACAQSFPSQPQASAPPTQAPQPPQSPR